VITYELSLFFAIKKESLARVIWGVFMVKYKVIVLAAGQGKRMNVGKNKQFIQLIDEPLIVHTVRNFVEDDWCESIIIVLHEQDKDEMLKLFNQYPWCNQLEFVTGGKERQDSSYSGLINIQANPEDVVMIHDGARPFLRLDHLHELATIAKQKQAALLAVQVTDTIKQKTEKGLQTLDRAMLWAAQTPQAFQYQTIKKAHQLAREEEYFGTDDASLVERYGKGIQVQIVEGSYENVKLTTPDDILRAEMIVKKRGVK
jgi:2-C-methyl-D-erythritol 4-phosphate cytidylyltransferase